MIDQHVVLEALQFITLAVADDSFPAIPRNAHKPSTTSLQVVLKSYPNVSTPCHGVPSATKGTEA